MYTDPLELMREMLKHWLDTTVDPPPTWEAVITALKSPLVNKINVAAQLESKYCTQVHLREECRVEKTEGMLLSCDLGLIFPEFYRKQIVKVIKSIICL